MSDPRLLLTAVFGPYGVKDDYGEDIGCQMELLDNQITRGQGVHSPRQSYWSFALYLMAENVSVDTTVLDFPTWEDFTRELERGYTHVGISFIVPNVLKARRMAEHIREHHPETKIILGGYGTIIPEIREMLPFDEICRGEGVAWLRGYFGDDVEAPIRHPQISGPAYQRVYGFSAPPRGSILLPGVGCENACTFCVTSHNFGKRYVPLLRTGRELFQACLTAEQTNGSRGFSIMDENFLKQPERARELLAEMEAHGKAYVFDIFSSAEVVKELGVDFLVRLGVRMIWIGVESQNNPHAKLRGIDLEALFEELQSNGIVVNASLILFQDHHDDETIQEDIDWVIGLGSCLTQFMNYTPYPTTSLHARLKKEGRLEEVHYRHHHGQGRLNFEHPHFDDPQDHEEILKAAFQKKYEVDGPGILQMARTAARGMMATRDKLERNEREGRAWDPETRRYEPSSEPVRDDFLWLRLRKQERIAMNSRPALLPGRVFAPNGAARALARDTEALFVQALGPASLQTRLQSLALCGLGAVEAARIRLARVQGQEGIVYQPPCRREVFPARLAEASSTEVGPLPVLATSTVRSSAGSPARC